MLHLKGGKSRVTLGKRLKRVGVLKRQAMRRLICLHKQAGVHHCWLAAWIVLNHVNWKCFQYDGQSKVWGPEIDFSPETNEKRAVQTDIFIQLKLMEEQEQKSAQLTRRSFKLRSCEKQRDAGEFSTSPSFILAATSKPSSSSASNCFNYISIYCSWREGCLLN